MLFNVIIQNDTYEGILLKQKLKCIKYPEANDV